GTFTGAAVAAAPATKMATRGESIGGKPLQVGVKSAFIVADAPTRHQLQSERRPLRPLPRTLDCQGESVLLNVDEERRAVGCERAAGKFRTAQGVAPEFVDLALRRDAHEILIFRAVFADEEITPGRDGEVV